jgi:DNA polymerase-4
MQSESTRAIAHFDLDAFFVSVERKVNPRLEGKPLIVGWHSERGVVAACSYETRKFGVHSAMPMKNALRLCPDAWVVPPSRGRYGQYSAQVTELIAEAAPIFEKASIDEFYLDLTGMDRFVGCYRWAVALRQRIIRETGLPVSFALSVNKLVSKIAVDTVKPNGQIEILPGREREFLAPMAVEKIPMVGPETALKLHKMGIFTIAQLAASSLDTLRTFLGKQGKVLWERAQGIDFSPVCGHQEQKSISTETTFETDLRDYATIAQELLRLNRINARALRRTGKYASCISIKIRYADFETVNRQVTVPPTSTDAQTGAYVRTLLEKTYQRNRPVRLLGVCYTKLDGQLMWPDLFSEEASPDRLTRTLDSLKDRFGEDAIGPAG